MKLSLTYLFIIVFFLPISVLGQAMGVGLNYVGDVYLLDNNEFSLPEYTVWQGSVYYEQPKYRVSLKVDNITDETYFQGTFGAIRPGMPRRVLLGMQFRF